MLYFLLSWLRIQPDPNISYTFHFIDMIDIMIMMKEHATNIAMSMHIHERKLNNIRDTIQFSIFM